MAATGYRSPERQRARHAKLRRRSRSIAAVTGLALAATFLLPLWLPLVLVADAVRGRFRFPLARLGLFGVCWAWIEVAGIAGAAATWLVGRAHDPATQYGLMRWWSGALMAAMETTIGIRPRLEGRAALATGNAIVFARHASLADSLLSAWAIRVEADLWPRYVLKRELLHDPCLDVVGLRVPNHFLDRSAGEEELDDLRTLSAGLGDHEVGVIFPEGTRANPHKRRRALDRIAARDPERAARLRELAHLLPPRPGGAAAMLAGAPNADVVLAWHTGFDGLDTFAGMIAKLALPLPPIRFVVRRVHRAEIPDPDTDPSGFERWLDEQWLRMDNDVAAALTNSS